MSEATNTILEGHAPALAAYPHARRAGGFIYVSGASSRRPDGTHVGATERDEGGASSWTSGRRRAR